jgi:hypothetical protein
MTTTQKTSRKILEHPSDGSIRKFSFTDGLFEGIIFSYGRVQLIETRDQLCIKYDYEIYNRPENFHEAGFKTELNDHLYELLILGLAENSLVYTNGT